MAIWGSGISLKGEDGSKIFFVTGQPTDESASAKPGDVAFATDTSIIYQRGAEGWPTEGKLLQGGMGLAGTNAQLYVQAGPPSDDLGKGDDGIYIQSDTGALFSRDAADASWSDSGTSLIGPAGPAGAEGPAGPAGETVRGVITYTGSGAPSNDLSTFSPGPAQPGDLYYSLGGPTDPTLYVLGQ